MSGQLFQNYQTVFSETLHTTYVPASEFRVLPHLRVPLYYPTEVLTILSGQFANYYTDFNETFYIAYLL